MALKADIYTKNFELTDRVQEYVTRKAGKLDRFLNDVDEARIDLDYLKTNRSAADRHVAQITLRGKGYILRSEETADDLFAAIDAAVDKMQRQIERYKGKRAHGRGDGTPASAVAGTEEIEETAEEDEGLPVIARRKRFTLAPMDEMEAIEQMNLLGHEEFFVFYNANTSQINVLYQRKDGTYGLIEPQLG